MFNAEEYSLTGTFCDYFCDSGSELFAIAINIILCWSVLCTGTSFDREFLVAISVIAEVNIF